MFHIEKKEHIRWRKSGSIKRGDAVFEFAPGYFWFNEQGPVGPYKSEESALEAAKLRESYDD